MMLRPAATARNASKFSFATGANPVRCQSSGVRAERCGIAVETSAVQALRSRPMVSTRAAAAGPSATQAINGPTTKRLGMRCTRSGTIPAAATSNRTAAMLAGVA